MPRIVSSHNTDIEIEVEAVQLSHVPLKQLVNLYIEDRHESVNAYLSIEETEQLISDLQAAVCVYKGEY